MHRPDSADSTSMYASAGVALKFSRRSLLTSAAGLAVAGARLRTANAAPVYEVLATTAWDRVVDLRRKPENAERVVGSLDPGTVVRLIAGPNAEGMYNIQSTLNAKLVGWVPVDALNFTQTARATVETALYAGAGDWTGWMSSVRRGFVVELRGAPTAGYVFARLGDAYGWTPLGALEASSLPPTNPYAESWIDVNRSTLQVHLMIGDTPINSFPAAMSSETGDGFYSTAPGSYQVYNLRDELHYTPYANAYITYWVGFDPSRDNGFHSWTMDANGYVLPGGDGNTGGCVATAPEHAAMVSQFSWIDMRVEVHW